MVVPIILGQGEALHLHLKEDERSRLDSSQRTLYGDVMLENYENSLTW